MTDEDNIGDQNSFIIIVSRPFSDLYCLEVSCPHKWSWHSQRGVRGWTRRWGPPPGVWDTVPELKWFKTISKYLRAVVHGRAGWPYVSSLMSCHLASHKMNNCVGFSSQKNGQSRQLILNSSQSSHVISHGRSEITNDLLHCLVGKRVHFLLWLIASSYTSEAV